VRLEGSGKLHLIGTRTRGLPACSIVPQPTTLLRAPSPHVFVNKMIIKGNNIEEVNLTESSRQDSIAGFCDHDEDLRSFSTTV
jgi:hypothetical protein